MVGSGHENVVSDMERHLVNVSKIHGENMIRDHQISPVEKYGHWDLTGPEKGNQTGQVQ